MLSASGGDQSRRAAAARFTLVLNVSPDLAVFAYVLVISVFAGVLFGLGPALASSRSALFLDHPGTGTSLVRNRLRQGLIAAQVAVSLTLMIAGGLLVRSANHALEMDTDTTVNASSDLYLQFPEERPHTADHTAAIVRDLRSRLAALPGVAAITSARAPDDNGGRRAGSRSTATSVGLSIRRRCTTPGYRQTISRRSASR